MSKDTMSKELTEMIQEKAKPKQKPKGKERVYIHWKFKNEGESPDGYEQKPTGNEEQ